MSEWIEWKGGNCPTTEKVEVKLKDDSISKGMGNTFSWNHVGVFADIIAYRYISEKPIKSFAELYPAYYKDISDHDEMDVYLCHKVFDIQDPSGAIQHASKKLLLSGSRTGGKEAWKDIKEARDTLSRWLQLEGHE